MATLIAYRTTHGTVLKAAEILSNQLKDECVIVDIRKDKVPDLKGFETVIIGGSIHMGTIQTSVKHFVRKNQKKLLKRNVGLFICHYEQGDRAREEFDHAFPENIREHAKAIGLFGGEFNIDKMNFLYKKITMTIGKSEIPPSRFREDKILDFVKDIEA